MKRSVAVTIAGQRYTLKSDADDAYVHDLAKLVDEKVREVRRGAKTATPQAVAILAALQLADELTRERDRRAQLRRRIRETSRTLRQAIEREAKA